MDGYTLCRSAQGRPPARAHAGDPADVAVEPAGRDRGPRVRRRQLRPQAVRGRVAAGPRRARADRRPRARARAGPGRPPRDRRRARAGDRLPVLDLRGDRPPRRRADALLPLARPALPAHGRAQPRGLRTRRDHGGAGPRDGAAGRARRVDRDRRRAHRGHDDRPRERRARPTSASSCAPGSTCSASCSSSARTRSCSPTRSCAPWRPSATRRARRWSARCCTSTSSAACRSARPS